MNTETETYTPIIWESVEQTAGRLGLTVRTVRDNCRKGIFPGKKVGKSWLLNPKEVDDLIYRMNIKDEVGHGTETRLNKMVGSHLYKQYIRQCEKTRPVSKGGKDVP